MGIKTGIGWCDSTVNELVGCDGCELHQKGKKESHCYANGLVRRYAGLPGWPISFDSPELMRGRLAKAIKWPDLTGTERPDKPWLNGYPRIIFPCDLSDPFTESVDPEGWLTEQLPAMAASPHIYILLTKRGRRMLEYWRRHSIPRNVWPGVSVTGPETVKRVEYLLAVPGASVRLVSAGPLLGPVDLAPYLRYEQCGGGHVTRNTQLDWVICEGESGPNSRAMDPLWAQWLRDQCVAAHVPFFFKQWGGVERGRWLDDVIWSEMPRAA